MATTRRRFLAQAAATGLAVSALPSFSALGGLQPAGAAGGGGKAAKSLKILILGGTGFLGPACVDAAKARGHQVTIFNRGRREELLDWAPEGVEKIYGNRDPKKFAKEKFVDGKMVEDETSPKGLSQLEGKKWDAVIDNSGYVPRIVKASAELLAPNVGQYMFVSSISAYKNNDKPNKDESDEVATMDDPTNEEVGKYYGALKVLCEKEADKAFPGRCTNIRPGYIVGPLDSTDRFNHWPIRVSKGGEVLVPGEPTDPVQFIDVRDLAEFMIHCLETKTTGYFNCTGPEKKYTAAELMAACLDASKKTGGKTDATFTYVPSEWLEDKPINDPAKDPGRHWPILIAPKGEYAGFHTRDVSKSVKAGMKFRPPVETCVAILQWWPGAQALRKKVYDSIRAEAAKGERPPVPEQDVKVVQGVRQGPLPEREAELLKLWHEEQGKKK